MFCRASLTCVIFLLFVLNASLGFAQEKPAIAGDYTGTLGPLHIKLRIKASPDGSLSGTLVNLASGVGITGRKALYSNNIRDCS